MLDGLLLGHNSKDQPAIEALSLAIDKSVSRHGTGRIMGQIVRNNALLSSQSFNPS